MFFFKKKSKPEPSYTVFMSTAGKYKHLIQALQAQAANKSLIICHFEQTAIEVRQLMQAARISQANVLMSYEIGQAITSGYSQIFVAELHPIKVNNDSLLNLLPEANRDKIIQLVSLDEVALKPFDSHRIIDLMLKMGMKEDDAVTHNLVQKSISQALVKWGERLKSPKDVRTSQADWGVANPS